MKSASNTKLAAKRENYRLWFEFLRLAKKSGDKRVRDALKRSEEFYRPWGDIEKESFHDWWKHAGPLFEEQRVVRRLNDLDVPDAASLVVEIPLNQSTTRLLHSLRAIIEQGLIEQTHRKRGKNKTVATATYRLTEGSEPKLRAIREMLTVYRDFHLKNSDLSGIQALRAIEVLYSKRKQKEFQRVPMALSIPGSNSDLSTPMRNLRRYITRAEKIVLNVANGDFPGKY